MDARTLLFALVLALSGCRNPPESYAPPAQRQPFESFKPYAALRIVDMAAPGANSHFIQDISSKLENGAWRWTDKRPTVRVNPNSNLGLTYLIDFATPEITFKKTGPVTIAFYVNDHLLDRVRYDTAGRHQFQKPVPPDWVSAGQNTTLAAEIDKLYIAKEEGGKRYGFVLVRIGLLQ